MIFGAILFYAGINVGFITPDESQFNRAIWIEACLHLIQSNTSADQQKEGLDVNGLLSDLKKGKSSGKEQVASISFDNNSFNALPPDSTITPPDTAKAVNDSLAPPLDSLGRDSSLALFDSLAADTVKIDSAMLDSTARLKFFRYHREDRPYLTLERKKESKFFAQTTQKLRTVQIDSTGENVEIVEKVAGQATKILLTVPLHEYIELQLALREREIWEAQGYKYELKESQKSLADLIKDFTDFEIPLPSVGVLSIFGPPKIQLKIQGSVDIHGAWRNETTEGVTASRLGNTRNEPDFKQQVQINVKGTIGDKLDINADWNTENTFEYENQLKIKYTGYEDEIVQSVEAGNVSLQTSSLVGGSEALFGIKAMFKMGPLTLTTIASQKKGEVKEVSVSSGTTSNEFTIRAYNYSQNHYFIDDDYADTTSLNIFENYYNRRNGQTSPIIVNNGDYDVTEIEVWKSTTTTTIDALNERNANAYINLGTVDNPNGTYTDEKRGDLPDTAASNEQVSGRFVKLVQDNDYILHEQTGYITFKTSIQDNDILAVAYKLYNGDTYGEFISTRAGDDSTKLVLKLIKPKNLDPSDTEAWKLQLRNIYPVGGRSINEEGFEFYVKREISGEEPVTQIDNITLLKAFGIDNYDAAGTSNSDNLIDYKDYVISSTGEVIFPVLQPFGTQIYKTGLDTSFAYPEVYSVIPSLVKNYQADDKWIMTGKYSGTSSSTYQLGFNIVENSVVVKLNGATLTTGVDYVVDYNIGQLTIRNASALVAGADLKITYEQNDLFQLASKTMLGARGVFDFTDKTKLGFSILNLSQQTLSDKVRIGEEPLSNTIMGVDFTTTQELPFLTKAIDNVFSTKQMSTISLAGEYAYISPDPNTKKSTISSDMEASIAYIDDFEGTKRSIPIGVSYTGWKDMSPPVGDLPYMPDELTTAEQRISYKAKAFWFSQYPSDVEVTDIWPLRQTSSKDNQVSVMELVYYPDKRGAYNYYPTLGESGNRKANFGGMMKYLSSSSNNLVEENIEYIEVWMNVASAPSLKNSYFYIDLGTMSEDVLVNKQYDTEDTLRNGVLNDGEDVGIDYMTDDQEKLGYRDIADEYKDDPSGDNWSYPANKLVTRDWININNTQGNSQMTDGTLLPDTEDLNSNSDVDKANNFFRFKVPLDTVAADNPFIVGGGAIKEDKKKSDWYQYRIPLKDFTEAVGSPTLSSVEYIRVFLTGYDTTVHLRFAEFNLIGSQWENSVENDTTLSVSVISYEENPAYSMPPGINRERDRSNTEENVLKNEQSMNLIINGLEPGDSREAVKYLVRALDVFSYKQMKLFVHGDTDNFSRSLADTTNGYKAQVYFRFGTDSNNFYEYRQPVTPDWGEIEIPFEILTAIKEGRDSAGTVSLSQKSVSGKSGHFYGVKGNPTLTSIKYLSVGIYNVDDPWRPRYRPLNGEVWINELRVIGADDTPGWAYSVSGSVKMADILGVSFNMSETDPFFHKISERFGSRTASKNWGMSADLDILKLLPFKMPESNLRLTYSHNENISKPLYMPGTDVLVKQVAETATKETKDQVYTRTQTFNVSDTWTASNIKLKIPTDFWLIRDTFNALAFSFTYNKTSGRSPTILSNKTWVWNASANYGINFSPDYFFRPADIPVMGTVFSLLDDYKNAKVYFTPQNFSFNLSAKRNRATSVTRQRSSSTSSTITPSATNISRDFSTSRGFNFAWRFTEGGLLNISSTYTVNINSSLAYLETDSTGLIQTPEREIWKEIFTSAFFGKDYSYTQNLDFRTAPKLPSFWDLNKFFTVNMGYSVSYQWQRDLKQEELGRNAGFSSKATVGLSLRLKALSEPLFKEDETDSKTNKPPANKPPGGNKTPGGDRTPPGGNKTPGGNRDLNQLPKPGPGDGNPQLAALDSAGSGLADSLSISDSLSLANADSVELEEVGSGISPVTTGLAYMKAFIRVVFFDYETITFNFSSDHSLSKSGIRGMGNGFNNFWGLQRDYNGPSRGFMFGLSQHAGARARLGNLSDVSSQKNNFDFKTSRPLWEGAKIDINWKVSWSNNKTTTVLTDSIGTEFMRPPTATGSLSRSFLALPNFLFIDGGIAKVAKLYKEKGVGINSLSAAFSEGLEQFPLLAKIPVLNQFSKYIPRPNWRLSWDGLEKYFIFSSFAKKMTLDHAYTSSYTEGYKTDSEGFEKIQTQRVEYGFTPIAGINFTFNELWGGNFTSNIKYGTKTIYDLGVSTLKVTETFSRDIGITAGYSLSGVEIPLFGIALKNDIEFSFSYTNTRNSVVVFDMNAETFNDEGTPQDGSTRVTLEPRVKYTLSAKVTLTVFYRRATVEPEGAAKYPPTTTNEMGLDAHIQI